MKAKEKLISKLITIKTINHILFLIFQLIPNASIAPIES